MAPAIVINIPNKSMKKIFAFDIPGLGSSLCSRGGSYVFARGKILERDAISSGCGKIDSKIICLPRF